MKLRIDTRSIGFKVWGYLMLFSLAILLMLWLMQTVFLNVFYQGMKEHNIAAAAEKIESIYGQVQGQAFQTRLNGIANDSDVFVNILSSDMQSLYMVNPSGRDYRTPVENMDRPPDKPAGEDGSGGQDQTGRSSTGSGGMAHFAQSDPFAEFAARVLTEPSGKIMQHFDDIQGRQMMLYGKVITSANNGKTLLIISSPLQPLTEQVRILQRQLVYISLIILLLALGISVVIALSIARPLTRITGKAGLLAKGKYDIRFDRGGYSEVSQLADTLNYATGQLQQVEGLRNELIANVSHDLRTPLTMIKLYAEMIRDLNGDNRAKREQNVAVIIEESERLASLVQNLLDLSRLQSGAMPFQPAVFDLTGTVRRILPRYDALVQKDGYRFRFDELREIPVRADEARIEQVLYNLINNAVNYAGEDREIALTILDRGDAVRVQVTDHGEGIDPEKLELIWDRYYKVDKEHRRAAAGSGLGLSIVKSILDLHGMKCGVSSVKGQGATFWFELEKAQ